METTIDKSREKRINRAIKIYPWSSGFTADLLFYPVVDTLFLTLVKNLSAAQIVSLTSFSQLVCILLQFPVLFVIKKIGNTASVRLAGLLLFLSPVFITLGANYYMVLLGRILHDVAVMFRTAVVIILENNLELLDRRSEFIRTRTKATTIYSVITMLISFVASYMFTLNHYLPMIACITCCFIGFVLTIFVKDYSDRNKLQRKKKSRSNVKVKYSGFVITAAVLYACFHVVLDSTQSDGKLFIQEELFLDFSENTTALILGVIVCISRIIRVLSNLVFAKIYEKHQEKTGITLTLMLISAVGVILFGSFIPLPVLKIVVFSLGYAVVLFVRDPFNIYIQDVILTYTPHESHQNLITIKNLGTKILKVGSGLIFSAILLEYPMVVVMAILFVMSVTLIFLSIKLYRGIVIGKAEMQNK